MAKVRRSEFVYYDKILSLVSPARAFTRAGILFYLITDSVPIVGDASVDVFAMADSVDVDFGVFEIVYDTIVSDSEFP